MFDWRQKRAFRSVLASPLLQVLLFGLVVMVGFSVYERYRIAVLMAERRAAVEAQLASLEARRAILQERVDYLSNERGIEAELRRQFDVARQGEQVVVLVDPPQEAATVQPLTSLSEATTTAPRWYQFWR
jgi:cell division protein FtsB